jgi:hypothetical protein
MKDLPLFKSGKIDGFGKFSASIGDLFPTKE